MTPHEEWARRFGELQDAALRHYGVEAKSRYIDLARPAIRAHVLEAGTGEPALILHGGDGEAGTGRRSWPSSRIATVLHVRNRCAEVIVEPDVQQESAIGLTIEAS